MGNGNGEPRQQCAEKPALRVAWENVYDMSLRSYVDDWTPTLWGSTPHNPACINSLRVMSVTSPCESDVGSTVSSALILFKVFTGWNAARIFPAALLEYGNVSKLVLVNMCVFDRCNHLSSVGTKKQIVVSSINCAHANQLFRCALLKTHSLIWAFFVVVAITCSTLVALTCIGCAVRGAFR